MALGEGGVLQCKGEVAVRSGLGEHVWPEPSAMVRVACYESQ